MNPALRLVYAAAATIASVASRVVPPGPGKTSLAIHARRGIRERYRRWADEHRDRTRPLLWMHAPSVGEGLQARPVLTLLRERRPPAGLQLAYTFFSPSAEEFSRGLNVDFRDYLPFDTWGDASAALDALAPRALVFSKLDVWPELVRQAKRRGVRLGMISATMAPGSGRRGPLARLLLRDAYASLDAVGAVDAADADRLLALGVRREVLTVTGDTRFDQVWQRAESVDRASRLLSALESSRFTLVAGSTWPADEAQLLPGVARARRAHPGLRLIIAPHETTPEHLAAIEQWAAATSVRLARVDASDAGDADVVLVDRFGILGDLYALADVAFVGGGFHAAGLHSVLEPAAYGAPVFFGPRHHASRDATLLLNAGGARVAGSATEVESLLRGWIGDAAGRQRAAGAARNVVASGRGAAERSVSLLERLLDG